MRLDIATGRVVWRASDGKPLSAGPGAGESVVAVGTAKGEVLSFDPDDRRLPHLAAVDNDDVTSHSGCPFAPRCPHANDKCRSEEPPLLEIGRSTVRCHKGAELFAEGQGA